MKTIDLYILATVSTGEDEKGRPTYKYIKKPIKGKQIDEYCAVVKFKKSCYNITDLRTGVAVTGIFDTQKEALAAYDKIKFRVDAQRQTKYYSNITKIFDEIAETQE